MKFGCIDMKSAWIAQSDWSLSAFKICLLIDDVTIEATAILSAHVVNKTVGGKAADNAPLLCNDDKFDFSS